MTNFFRLRSYELGGLQALFYWREFTCSLNFWPQDKVEYSSKNDEMRHQVPSVVQLPVAFSIRRAVYSLLLAVTLVARGRFELPSMGPKPIIDRVLFSTLASPLHHRATRNPPPRPSTNKACPRTKVMKHE